MLMVFLCHSSIKMKASDVSLNDEYSEGEFELGVPFVVRASIICS